MKEKKYLGTGEFAKLCRTTKETLYHYDDEGLLKPRHVSEKGYRRYAAEQFFVFDLITVLKEAGSSLAEIRRYLGSYDPHGFLRILRDKQEQFVEEQKRLALRKEALDRIAEATHTALDGKYGVIRTGREPEERLVVTAVEDPGRNTWDETARNMSRHFSHCARVGLTTISPVGAVILQENVKRRVPGVDYYFSTDNSAVAPARFLAATDIMVKPEGMYATVLHKGSFDELAAGFPRILARVARRGFRAAGHAYIYDLLSYLASESEEDDVYKLAIQIG